MIGFTDAMGIAPVIGREPANFIGFIASSSTTTAATGADWYVVVRNGSTRQVTDTLIPSTTITGVGTSSPQRLRIEVTNNAITFLINGNIATTVTQSIPTNANLAPSVSAGTSIGQNAGNGPAYIGGTPGNARINLFSMRLWVDDPPGGESSSSGGLATQDEQPSADWQSQSNISEFYQLNDPQGGGTGSGNIASIDLTASTSAHIVQTPYDQSLLGVLVDPGTSYTSLGFETGSTARIAISGRAMVNVSTENGSIKSGDPITSGSIAGFGMKATRPGFIIGHALESLDASSTSQCPVNPFETSTQPCRGLVLVALNVGFDMNAAQASTTWQLALAVPAKLADALGELASGAFYSTVQFASLVAERVVAQVAVIDNLFADHITANVIDAEQVNTNKLCVGGLCVTRDQLQNLLNGVPTAAASSSGSNGGSSNNGGDTGTTTGNGGGNATSTPDTEAPVVSLSGNNPAQVYVGDSYTDLGATVSDNVDENLGFKVSLDGGPAIDISQLSLDTSTSTSYTIVFSSTDTAGNTGTASRTVNVVTP